MLFRAEILPVTLILHRGHIFSEFYAAVQTHGLHTLMQQPLVIKMLLPNGAEEIGEDTGGILRDALSEYWETFYTKCSTDGEVRVPVLRHDMMDTWAQCACVLVLGYKIQGYLPASLATPFLQHCMGINPSSEHLVETFVKMLPTDERKVIKNPDFSDEDFEDFLTAHDVRKIVNEENWPTVLFELAHKVIIQEPAFVSDMWSPILKENLNLDADQLNDILTAMQPTPKKHC